MKNGSFQKGLSELVIRVCVGPAEGHLEPCMCIGWQRFNLIGESINMSAILHRELLNPCLSKRTNMEATDVLCLLSRPPGARGIFKDQACRYITPGRRLDSPFEKCKTAGQAEPQEGTEGAKPAGSCGSACRQKHRPFRLMSECIQKREDDREGQGWNSLALHQAIKPTVPGLLWETADSQGVSVERIEPAGRGMAGANAHRRSPQTSWAL